MKRVIYIYLWAVATYICLRSSLSLKLHFPQKFQSFWAFSLICILPFKTTHSSQWVSIKVMKKNKSERESRCGWDQGYHYKKKPSKSIQTDISTSPKKFHRERERERRVGSFSRRKYTLDWREKVMVFPWIESVIKHGYLCPHTWFRVRLQLSHSYPVVYNITITFNTFLFFELHYI